MTYSVISIEIIIIHKFTISVYIVFIKTYLKCIKINEQSTNRKNINKLPIYFFRIINNKIELLMPIFYIYELLIPIYIYICKLLICNINIYNIY